MTAEDIIAATNTTAKEELVELIIVKENMLVC